MNFLTPAKFALLYKSQREAVINDGAYGDRAKVVTNKVESPVSNPAVFEIGGVRLYSRTPESAAEAAEINEALKAAVESLHMIQ